MAEEPAAFMSYVRFNDQHDDGQLTQFRERLSAEVRAQTGTDFPIFQDRNDITWGQRWQDRIDGTLDSVTLLLVIITPGLFRSPACRQEVRRFLEREHELGRRDLILPVYYITAREMDDPAARGSDELAETLAARQYADWRELRFEAYTSPAVRKAVARLAERIRDAIWTPPDVSTNNESSRAELASLAVASGQSDAHRRIVAKVEPPTHVVDPYQRGDFATLEEAIKAARPGDRILVRPGLYEGGLVIDKPLEILGDGPVEEIEIRARSSDAVLFKASIGRIANLTLRQAGGNGRWYAVDITQGRLDLEGCDISAQNGTCVGIHGGADPRIRRNRIHDGQRSGVLIYDEGRGTLEDNDIYANAMTGIAIKTGGDPTLRRNRVRDGQQSGVYIYDHGRGTLEDNDIFGNARGGVVITSNGDPMLRRNRIHAGRATGVFLHDGGHATLEENDIDGNALAGVEIKTGSDATMRRNRIHDGKSGGVYIHTSGHGTLEDNDIYSNALAGVEIKTGGEALIRGNRIHDGKGSGVYVHDGGRGTLEDNDVFGNERVGVRISKNSDATLRGNRINRNAHEGINVSAGSSATVEDNNLTGNIRGPWRIAADSTQNVTRARNKES